MARALADGTLAPGPTVLAHLDHCLDCLSCQKVCPSGVRYGEIIDLTRAGLAPRRAPPGGLSRLLGSPRPLTRAARVAAVFHADRWLPAVARLLPRTSRWRRLAAEQPVAAPVPREWRRRGLQPKAGRRRVILFTGCVASIYDRDTLAAARILIEAAGHEVAVPAGFQCCGALARHAGDSVDADHLAAEARERLGLASGDTVLVSASGCFGEVRDRVVGAGGTTLDVATFLACDPGFEQLRFRRLDARVALHLPCTEINVVGGDATLRDLLGRIPGLEVQPLPLQPRCCGAAGHYFIEHAAVADRLRRLKLDQIRPLEPASLLTSNVGCRIFLGNGLRQQGVEVPVLHPLTLLARQLDATTT